MQEECRKNAKREEVYLALKEQRAKPRCSEAVSYYTPLLEVFSPANNNAFVTVFVATRRWVIPRRIVAVFIHVTPREICRKVKDRSVS